MCGQWSAKSCAKCSGGFEQKNRQCFCIFGGLSGGKLKVKNELLILGGALSVKWPSFCPPFPRQEALMKLSAEKHYYS